MAEPKSYRVGPGSLKLGDIEDELEISQQLKAFTVSWEKDKEDDDNVAIRRHHRR